MTPPELAAHFIDRVLRRFWHEFDWPEGRRIEVPAVLDPACGSGNLLVAYAQALADKASQSAANRGLSLDPRTVLAALGRGKALRGLELDEERASEARRRLVQLTGEEEAAAEIQTCDALFTDWPPAALILGNPPFLGGGRVSSLLGDGYRKQLMKAFPTWKAHADFCVCWLLKAHEQGARLMSWIATNTLAQGDTRLAGLKHLVVEKGWKICEAERSVKWPGDAKVTCVIVHMALDVQPSLFGAA